MYIYRFFHIRRLTYEVGGRMTTSNLAIMSNQVCNLLEIKILLLIM